jgi:16S rRNA (uracil1498-N3)-methyltransferase
MPRFYCPATLASGQSLALPETAARHVQVLRLQPGVRITLFNGAGGEFDAEITRIGRSEVQVNVEAHSDVEREAPREIHLAVGMPANERMDWLVEKATELGAASIQPLVVERSVLKLKGERAERRRAHWQAIAIAACEQCGRNRVPPVHEIIDFSPWLAQRHANGPAPLLLSPGAQARALRDVASEEGAALFLSGPEGGLSAAEEEAAIASGFTPVSLGSRVLRAETAALAALAAFALG